MQSTRLAGLEVVALLLGAGAAVVAAGGGARYWSLVIMPLVVFLFVAAEELVLAILGPAWLAVVPVYRALAPAAMMSTFEVATGWVYLSWGHTNRQFRWVVLTATVQALAFFIGVSWGTIGVAIAFSIAVVVLRLPGVAYCFRGTPLRFGPFLAVIARPAAVSMAAGGALYLVRLLLVPEAPVGARLALDAVTAVYPVVWLLVPGGRRVLRDVIDLVAVILGKRAPEGAEG